MITYKLIKDTVLLRDCKISSVLIEDLNHIKNLKERCIRIFKDYWNMTEKESEDTYFCLMVARDDLIERNILTGETNDMNSELCLHKGEEYECVLNKGHKGVCKYLTPKL